MFEAISWCPTKLRIMYHLQVLTLVVLCLTFQLCSSTEVKRTVECEVAIVGAGAAGMFATYKLAPQFGPDLCLIEKETRVGGKAKEVSEKGVELADDNAAAVFALGPMKITNQHHNMLALGKQLGIEFRTQSNANELYKARGHILYKSTENVTAMQTLCKEAFPTISCEAKSPEKAMWEKLLSPDTFFYDKKMVAEDFADFRAYAMAVLGDEGYQFLRESSRLNSFLGHHSLKGMQDFFDYAWGDGRSAPRNFYPVGGMSQYHRAMQSNAVKQGTRFFLGEPAIKINKTLENPDSPFIVETRNSKFKVHQVIIAMGPSYFKKIKGNVAELIQQQPQFNAIQPNKLITVAAWWNSRWWESAERPVDRVISHENCFNSMEVPSIEEAKAVNATRAVFDDGVCLDTWETLIAANNSERLAGEIMRGLQNVFTDREVPKPRTVKGQVFGNGWHSQTAESTFTNKEIADWATNPVPDQQLNIVLISDGYYLRQISYEASILSTMQMLSQKYNVSFPQCSCDVTLDSTELCFPQACRIGRKRRQTSQELKTFDLADYLGW